MKCVGLGFPKVSCDGNTCHSHLSNIRKTAKHKVTIMTLILLIDSSFKLCTCFHLSPFQPWTEQNPELITDTLPAISPLLQPEYIYFNKNYIHSKWWKLLPFCISTTVSCPEVLCSVQVSIFNGARCALFSNRFSRDSCWLLTDIEHRNRVAHTHTQKEAQQEEEKIERQSSHFCPSPSSLALTSRTHPGLRKGTV